MNIQYRSPRNKRQGFSLIELLVVISIMGIIMAIGAVSFSGAQRRGRDAKRRSDMTSIQKGFEQFFLDNGSQYDTCTDMGGSDEQFPAGLPLDPLNTGIHTYSRTCNATTYCYCARLEIEDSGNSSDGSCTYQTGGDFFCVSNLQ